MAFEKYKREMDIPDSIWNFYLRKYAHKFKLLKTEDQIWSIATLHGFIQPYSLKRGLLLHATDFPSKMMKTYFLKKIEEIKDKFEITQDGDNETVIVFKEEELDSLVKILKIRKKRIMSEEQKLKSVERLKQYQFKKEDNK